MANFSNRTNCVDDIKACDVNNLFLDITSTSSGHLHDGSNGRLHTSGNFRLKESSGCYYYAFVTSCIAANRNVTLPALSGNATFGFIDIAQSFTAAQTITTDADSEFIALKLTNQSDSANTCGFVTLEFDLEDTGGNAVDAAKISVKKEASFTATASTQDAKMEFALSLNGTMTERMTLASTGDLSIDGDLTVSGGDITVGTTAVITGGDTTSLDNIDALNATTEATIEGAIDTLSNLGTIGKACATTNIVAGDITMYNAVNGGNPTISLGSSCAERLVITANYDSSAQTLCNVEFATAAASGSTDKGKMVFDVDGTDIATIDDSGINLASGKTFRVNGSALPTSDTNTTYTGGDGITLNSTEFDLDAALTTVTSMYNASLKVGRDCNNQICFATDNHIIFKAHCNNEVQIIQNSIQPVVCDGAALGAVCQEWSDLFLASGAVINFATGNVTLTHSSCALTLGGGVLDLGSNSLEAQTIDYTDGDNAITIADGGKMTFPQQVTVTKNIALTQSCTCGDYSGITASFTAGEALERGEVVSIHTDGEVYKALAVGSTSGKINEAQPAIGVVVADASACAATTVLLQGFITCDTNFPTYTVGATLYVPEAETSCKNVPEGTAPDTDGDMVQVIGMAVKADSIYVNPDFTVIEVA